MMPKIAAELRPAAVKALASRPGDHPVGGVVGLTLQVVASTAKGGGPPVASWVLRRTVKGGSRVKLGLGSYVDVSLAAAREAARPLAEAIALGRDPLAERRKAHSQAQAAKQAALTFEEAAKLCIRSMEAGWKNAKHAAQWTSTLATYAHPVLGPLLVEDIEMAHVLKVLDPMWTDKPETATRVRGRIEKVIAFADARSNRERPNPARWKGGLDTQLANVSSVKKVRSHPALSVDDAPAFMAELRQMQGNGARALELAILCACRSSEVRGARWDEMDLAASTWTIPSRRMKMERPHRVPLSAAALALLKAQPRLADDQPGADLVFPAVRGGMLSDMTLASCIRRLNEKGDKPRWIDPRSGDEATAHGTSRSTFKDWAAERTHFPNEMSELALAHKVSNAVEAAYRRGDMLEKRRAMMDAWSTFLRAPSGGRSDRDATQSARRGEDPIS